ncbi:replication initiation protein [Pontibacter akesuensis]|uniref:Initiator Replication protein n=1 Tax=Pontibacter akesuensis TaxID=388950 RepID=A0A1I7KRA5_9BACT|nr:replication initiation protein [Pontibacter akesuensis]SFU99947.1 Initiator Replication protein [Pontibacter akesuensis]
MSDLINIPVKQPNKLVTQHNNLINSYFDIPTVQLRAFIYALGHIHKDDKELTHVKIPIDALYASKGGKNFKQVAKLATELQEIKFKVESQSPDKAGKMKRTYLSMVIFPTVSYTQDSRYIITKINNDLAPYLLDLKGNYTQAELEQLLSLKTIQAYRIYMFIKQGLFKDKPTTIKYRQLRLMLGLDLELNEDEAKRAGLPEGERIKTIKYPLFAEFKRRILDTAKEELLDTDMAFDYKINKKGRNADSITFHLVKTINVLPSPAPGALQADPKTLQQNLFSSPTPVLGSDKVTANAVRIMRDKYAFSEEQIQKYLQQLPPLVITRANNWFSTNKGTLTFTSEAEWFAKHLDNKISKNKG